MLKEITFLPCVHPPTTSQLVDGITDMLENNGNYENEEQARKYKRLAVHIRRNAPEKQWLIGLLGSLYPANEIFLKGYKPPVQYQH